MLRYRNSVLGAACRGVLVLSAGCGGSYLAVGDDPLGELTSPDPNVAALAALQIAACEDAELRSASLPSLCKLLHHRDPLVRSAAARALHEMTGAAIDYEPYRDPLDQQESIRTWQDLVERVLEAPE